MRARRVVILGTIAVLISIAAYVSFWFLSCPVTGPGTVMLFVYPGETGIQVAGRADSLHLFPSRESFLVLSRITGLDKELQVGRYDFTREHSRWDIYRVLKEGRSASVKVTIPEGLMMTRIIPIVAESLCVDQEKLSRLASDRQFIRSLGIDASSLEGYLFPQTYLLPWGAPPEYTLRILTRQLTDFLADSLMIRMRDINFDLHDLLTFASLVEAEARDGRERARISSVYHNRLRKGMLLQCDPTVIYAHGGIDRPLLYRDLEIDSPYNTYRYPGLPPGPICSPGGESILAALYPEDTRFLYFVADGHGRHIFSETLDQHNSARKRVKSQSD